MGSSPSVAPYVPPPAVNDPAIEAALAKEKLLARKRKGRAATMLSDPSSDASQGAPLKDKTGE